MKYCHRCGTGNPENQMFCQGCGRPMQKNAREVSLKMAREESTRQEKKETRRQKIGHCLLAGMYALHILLMLCACIFGNVQLVGVLPALGVTLIFPGLGYAGLYHPEWIFKLEHLFTIQNLDEVEVSDFYRFCSAVGGVLVWAGGIVLLTILCLAK